MENSCISGSVIADSVFKGARLIGDELIIANLSRVTWINSKWNNVDARLSNLSASTFKDSAITGSCLTQANIAGSVFEGHVSFAGSDLRKANLSGIKIKGSVDWTGAKLGGAVWMDGRICPENSIGGCDE
jgi:uncharacterized protein YjbI with pentapeptide repeats